MKQTDISQLLRTTAEAQNLANPQENLVVQSPRMFRSWDSVHQAKSNVNRKRSMFTLQVHPEKTQTQTKYVSKLNCSDNQEWKIVQVKRTNDPWAQIDECPLRFRRP
jgi:hypothetical protein